MPCDATQARPAHRRSISVAERYPACLLTPLLQMCRLKNGDMYITQDGHMTDNARAWIVLMVAANVFLLITIALVLTN